MRNFYDPEGLRCKVEENGRTAWFVYDNGNIVAELEGEKLRAASIRGHELLMQRDGSGGQYYYLNNAHGDVEAMIDPSGVVANRYRYDAFGNILEAKERVHNRFKYAGEQYDEVTGQYYLRARFYNPVVGRFTQEDVYRGDGLNLYTYVQNNPIKYVDPSGYVCEQKLNLYKEYRAKGLSKEDAYTEVKKAFDGVSKVEKSGYKPVTRMSDEQLLRKKTNTCVISLDDIKPERIKFVGEDAIKIDAGTWRSLDGTRQFRVVPNDYLGKHGIGDPLVPNTPHVHFEFLAPPNPGGSNLRVIKNVHVPIK